MSLLKDSLRFSYTVPPEKQPMFHYLLFSSAILLFCTFIVSALLIEHIRVYQAGDKAPTRKVQDLVDLLNQSDEKRKNLEAEVNHLRTAMLKSENPSNSPVDAKKSPELQKLYRLAGLTPVEGPGLMIRLDTPKQPLTIAKNGAHREMADIQAEDILKLINELEAAGALAISVNGQRIVGQTEIVNSGTVMMVNKTHIAPPIEIHALGNAKDLEEALRLRGGILEYLNYFDIKTTVRQTPNLKVPAYQGSL